MHLWGVFSITLDFNRKAHDERFAPPFLQPGFPVTACYMSPAHQPGLFHDVMVKSPGSKGLIQSQFCHIDVYVAIFFSLTMHHPQQFNFQSPISLQWQCCLCHTKRLPCLTWVHSISLQLDLNNLPYYIFHHLNSFLSNQVFQYHTLYSPLHITAGYPEPSCNGTVTHQFSAYRRSFSSTHVFLHLWYLIASPDY